jgi:tetratricopeptide (TPR) repeat protein
VAAAKKKTRKELLNEPDEFLNLTSRVLRQAARFKNEILLVITGLLAAVAIYSGYVVYSNRQEAQAASLLSEAVLKHDRLSLELSKDKALAEAAGDFGRILSDFGSSANGNVARLVYANLCYEAGRIQQAVDLYQASLARFDGYPLIRFQILKSLGYAYEGLGDSATAVRYFELALSAAEKSLKDDVLFHLGELYGRLGDSQKSTEVFTRLISDHEDSIYANMVREKLNG